MCECTDLCLITKSKHVLHMMVATHWRCRQLKCWTWDRCMASGGHWTRKRGWPNSATCRCSTTFSSGTWWVYCLIYLICTGQCTMEIRYWEKEVWSYHLFFQVKTVPRVGQETPRTTTATATGSVAAPNNEIVARLRERQVCSLFRNLLRKDRGSNWLTDPFVISGFGGAESRRARSKG